MARLYIFAIGGTGSRVLKSLTMLLASGVKPNSDKNFEIVPIIIDPHKSNEDLKRTERLLGNYQTISNEVGLDSGFFSTKITTLDRLTTSQNRLSGSFTFNLQEVGGRKFSEYIGFNQLDEPNKALADILFSGKSINKRHEEVNLLDVEMDIGFVGNPNIGSIVLNQVKDSQEFKDFASNYNEDDRVFIISSIFGGTGAAGFPTILKNIRDAMNNRNIDGKGFLQDAKIGAITALPYFNIEKDNDSPIQKSDFIAKTKAALYYYKDNVTGNNSINSLYYIADNYSGKPYKNDPGDNGQKNDAHFVEMASALAIIDFLETPDRDLETSEGKALKPIYKEFGIRKDASDIKFSDLEDYTERKIALRLSQFALFRKYLTEHLSSAVENEAWSNDSPEINKKFVDNTFYRTNLTEFLNSFTDWLKEMAENKRGFSPFNIDSSIDALIKDRIGKYGLVFKSKVDYGEFNNQLSKTSKKSKSLDRSSAEKRLIGLFYETTESILEDSYGLKN
ncbi:hypothetical protein KUV50_02935 [Membranicola marinus]|uniref:Tubulin like n=1 Tax=Membranihabitans marinus TaxID=1227546 RepID=A0A953L7X4_9BACT|nr:hypothetical protein [Membranihabitans marinus]MBY5957075.1 hypothetical protein [Membranihabitans marinus]